MKQQISMSSESIKPALEKDTNHQSFDSSSEKIIFYMDNTSYEVCHELPIGYHQEPQNRYMLKLSEDHSPSLNTSDANITDLRLNNFSPHCLPHFECELSHDVTIRSNQNESCEKHEKNIPEFNQCPSQRSGVQTSRSRTNSCIRPPPLGNGRRNSVNRRVKSRRASTTHRKDSVRPLRMESLMQHKVVENVEDLQQARRHQRIAMIVLGTFLFLLAASVLVVVVTLTHSTFLSPATGSKELAEHRAGLRRENEELLNSLNRIFVPENSTLSP